MNSWFRTTLSIPLNEKIKTDIELQHRRQNDYGNDNLFDKNLMYTFRTWIYYKKNEDVAFGVSPFAYFSNYKIIQKEGDAKQSPANEYRFSTTVELQHKLINKFFIVDRTAFEYRIFEGAAENVIRMRNRLSFRYDFTAKFNMSAGDEVFINASGTDAHHIFDQDRFFTNFSFRPGHNIKLDVGYIYISRLPKNKTDLIDENNIYLNFTYTIQKRHG